MPAPSPSSFRPRPGAQALGERAIVIGASMAGLLTAAVLAGRFREVWLLERDTLPDSAQARKGTPQATHSHGLLARGHQIMEALLPGLTESLVAQGAITGDLGLNGIFRAGKHRFAQAESGIQGLAASRLGIEAEIRRRVLALPGVAAHTGIDVVNLASTPDGQTVTGVILTRRDAQGQPQREETLHADLVVDASGRASRTPRWLQALGFEPAQEERVGEGLSVGYATALFMREPVPQSARPIGAVICAVTPASPRGGVLIAQERDEQGRERWTMTIGGYGEDRPEPTLAGMRAYARKIDCPEFHEVLQHGTLIGEVMRYQFAHSQRRHYERLKRFPARLLTLGDAIASFNPIYGQGMTVAACEAVALAKALDQGLDAGLHRRFFKSASRIVDTPWQTAVGSDLALDFVPGKRTLATRLINAYVARIQVAAQHDAKVAAAFLRVGHLLKAPASLFAPNILLRVLRGNLRGTDASASHPQHQASLFTPASGSPG